MGFIEVLTLVFVVLKLTGMIDWSWWMVLAPMWMALILYITIAFFLLRTFWSKR
jgi:hypothetical protein